MEKFEKSIIIASLFVLIIAVFSSAWLLYSPPVDTGNIKINYLLPKNLDATKDNQATKQEEPNLSMLFVGDIMIDRHVKEKMSDQGVAYLFENLVNDEFDFFKYDIINANLEGAVTDGGAHYEPIMSYDFAFSPEVMNGFKEYNFNLFNLANNHVIDQGERGLKETRANLAKLGFTYYGCEDGQAGECSFAIYPVKGLKIGFAGFSMVYKIFNQAKANKIVTDLSGQTDLVIVSLHGGVEYSHNFNQAQRSVAHELIDAGADIIIGHHPHVVQGIEIYNNRPIFYSLGNFIFDQYFSLDTQQELAVELAFKSPSQAQATLYPLISKQSQPALMVGREKEKYLEKVSSWSSGNEELLDQIRTGTINIKY